MATPSDDHKPHINTIAMLGQAYSLLGFRIVEGVVGTGMPIKPRYSAVFAQFDPGRPDARRASDLARGAGMSPQAMGELLDELEGLGYVRREPDPTDRRAKLVIMTESGRESLRAGAAAVQGLEIEIDRVLGQTGHTELRSLLERLLAEG